ncbi:MAG: hypothetical protein AVDCRST_MAG93-102, partial [uncultured Chloroflexia bacterium]
DRREEPRSGGAWQARRLEGRQGPRREDDQRGAVRVGAEGRASALGQEAARRVSV